MEQPPESTDLLTEIKRLNSILTRLYYRQSVTRTFFNGVVYGLGSVFGATLVFALIIYFLGKVDLIPIIGTWLSEIVSEAMKNITP